MNRADSDAPATAASAASLLAELGEIDLFVHDSSHTMRNLRFEFEHAWGAIAAGGYTIALANYDTQDWERPGVRTILRNVLGEPAIHLGIGGIVLMHDAGGDRSETVVALPAIVKGLRGKGLEPVTIPRLMLDDPPPRGQPLPTSLAGD